MLETLRIMLVVVGVVLPSGEKVTRVEYSIYDQYTSIAACKEEAEYIKAFLRAELEKKGIENRGVHGSCWAYRTDKDDYMNWDRRF